jgi:hypothetical protein
MGDVSVMRYAAAKTTLVVCVCLFFMTLHSHHHRRGGPGPGVCASPDTRIDSGTGITSAIATTSKLELIVLKTPNMTWSLFEAKLLITPDVIPQLLTVNPFNYSQIQIQGNFSFHSPSDSPSARSTTTTHTVDAFWFQNYTRSLQHGAEQLRPDGKPMYLIRYTPQFVGCYEVVATMTTLRSLITPGPGPSESDGHAHADALQDRITSNMIQFCVVAAPQDDDHAGIMQVSSVNKRYFVRRRTDQPDRHSHSHSGSESESDVRCQTAAAAARNEEPPLHPQASTDCDSHPNSQIVTDGEDERGCFLVGVNVCWSTTNHTTYDYDDWFGSLASNHANYARIWLGPFDTFSVQTKASGLYHFDLANLWRLDYLLSLATDLDMVLQFCLDSFNSVRSSPPNNMWKNSPYNTANGGMCSSPDEFFSSDAAIAAWRNLARYLVSRFAHSSALLSWELFNEVDLADNFRNPFSNVSTTVTLWHKQNADYLKSLDVYSHMITTSFSSPAGFGDIDKLPQMSYVQTHSYGAKDFAAQELLTNAVKHDTYHKPTYFGEGGLTQAQFADDPTGIDLHNGLWGGIVSGGAGTAMLWWWDLYIAPQDLWWRFAGIGYFSSHILNPIAAQVQWKTLPVGVSNADSAVRASAIAGFSGSNPQPIVIIAWIQNTNHTWYGQYLSPPLPLHETTDATLTIQSGVGAANSSVQQFMSSMTMIKPDDGGIWTFYNTTSASVLDSNSQGIIPSFRTDVVAVWKASPQGMS